MLFRSTGVVEAQRRERKDKKAWAAKLKPGKAAAEDKPKGDDEGPEGLRVDQYLVVFLKFMSSIGVFRSLSSAWARPERS